MPTPELKTGWVRLQVELTPRQGEDLYTFIRRANYERVLQHCDGAPGLSADHDQCERMLEVLVILEAALLVARNKLRTHD